MNIPDGHLFFVHRDPGNLPPEPQLMRFLNPRNPFNVGRQGVSAPHTVKNMAHASKLYWEVLPKYKFIHRRLQSEHLKAYNLRKVIRRHRRSARKHMVIHFLLYVMVLVRLVEQL
jgi:hypothetical protein